MWITTSFYQRFTKIFFGWRSILSCTLAMLSSKLLSALLYILLKRFPNLGIIPSCNRSWWIVDSLKGVTSSNVTALFGSNSDKSRSSKRMSKYKLKSHFLNFSNHLQLFFSFKKFIPPYFRLLVPSKPINHYISYKHSTPIFNRMLLVTLLNLT